LIRSDQVGSGRIRSDQVPPSPSARYARGFGGPAGPFGVRRADQVPPPPACDRSRASADQVPPSRCALRRIGSDQVPPAPDDECAGGRIGVVAASRPLPAASYRTQNCLLPTLPRQELPQPLQPPPRPAFLRRVVLHQVLGERAAALEAFAREARDGLDRDLASL